MNSKGIGLLELLIAGTIGAIGLLIVISISNLFLKGQKQVADRGQMEESITLLSKHLLRVGRHGMNCVTLGSTEITCDVIRQTGGFYRARFRAVPAARQVIYEADPTGGTTFTQSLTYTNVDLFAVCGNNVPPVAGCPLPSAIGGANPGRTYSNRFFQFQLIGRVGGANDFSEEIRGSFFVRNPVDFAPLTYVLNGGF